MYAYEHLSTSQQVHPHLAVSPGVQGSPTVGTDVPTHSSSCESMST